MNITMNEANDALVSCEWLAERLGERDLVILDATFFLPNQGRDAESEYRVEHLPGARFFDIDRVADASSSLPHMLPSPEFFAACAGRLGIDNATLVVAYDNNSFLASARAWWMFRVFGHDRVSVLDGGLRRWKDLKLPVESDAASAPVSRSFRADYRPELVRNLDQMRAIFGGPGIRIIDARSAGRFAGTEPEPRTGVCSGHIPGSSNLPYRKLVDEASGLMKMPDAIREAFESLGLDLRQPIVTTCGTGVTAAILALGLYRLGREDISVYDGSWTEWGARGDTPVETGG